MIRSTRSHAARVGACIGGTPIIDRVDLSDFIVDLSNRMDNRIKETPVMRSSWSRRLVIGGLLASELKGLVA